MTNPPSRKARPKSPERRQPRTLAKPLVQAGATREAGETVLLRPDQIARLEPLGYFAAPGKEA